MKLKNRVDELEEYIDNVSIILNLLLKELGYSKKQINYDRTYGWELYKEKKDANRSN